MIKCRPSQLSVTFCLLKFVKICPYCTINGTKTFREMSDYVYLKSVFNFLISNNIPQVLLLMQCIFTTGTPHNCHMGWTHEVFFRCSCICCHCRRMHFLHWWYQTQLCQQVVTIVRRLDTTKKLKHVHPVFQLGELPCEWLKPAMCTWSQWEGGQVLLFPWDISALYSMVLF